MQRVLVTFSKSEPKLAAYLTKCRASRGGAFGACREATSFGFGGFRHGIQVKPALRAGRPDSLADTQRVLGQNLRFCSGARCVSGLGRGCPILRASFTRIPRRIRGLDLGRLNGTDRPGGKGGTDPGSEF